MNDYNTLLEEIRNYTEQSVKKSRFKHSERVAEMCSQICKRYGFDEKKAYLAGIGHDMCKDCSKEIMIELAKKDGNPVSDYEYKNPKLLHGRAAAVTMKEKFGITDPDVLEAVSYHTSGVENMCTLTKILFLADKIEPERPQSTDEYRSRLFSLSFDEMFFSVYEENYEFLIKKGYEIYPGTIEMLKYYKEELEKYNA